MKITRCFLSSYFLCALSIVSVSIYVPVRAQSTDAGDINKEATAVQQGSKDERQAELEAFRHNCQTTEVVACQHLMAGFEKKLTNFLSEGNSLLDSQSDKAIVMPGVALRLSQQLTSTLSAYSDLFSGNTNSALISRSQEMIKLLNALDKESVLISSGIRAKMKDASKAFSQFLSMAKLAFSPASQSPVGGYEIKSQFLEQEIDLLENTAVKPLKESIQVYERHSADSRERILKQAKELLSTMEFYDANFIRQHIFKGLEQLDNLVARFTYGGVGGIESSGDTVAKLKKNLAQFRSEVKNYFNLIPVLKDYRLDQLAFKRELDEKINRVAAKLEKIDEAVKKAEILQKHLKEISG